MISISWIHLNYVIVTVICHFQQHLSYIVAVSFIGRKPEYPEKTTDWQTLSHNVASSTPRHERDSNLQL